MMDYILKPCYLFFCKLVNLFELFWIVHTNSEIVFVLSYLSALFTNSRSYNLVLCLIFAIVIVVFLFLTSGFESLFSSDKIKLSLFSNVEDVDELSSGIFSIEISESFYVLILFF